MQTNPTTVWDELTSIAAAAATLEQEETAARQQLVDRIKAAIEHTRALEAELSEIRDDLEALV